MKPKMPTAVDRRALRTQAEKLYEVMNKVRQIPKPVIEDTDDNIIIDEGLSQLLNAVPTPKRVKHKKTPETPVVKACLAWLRRNGVFAWRNNTGAVSIGKRFLRYGYVGSSDIIGVTRHGRFVAVECKSAKGRQSDAQIAFQKNVEEHNGVYILAKSEQQLEDSWHEEY